MKNYRDLEVFQRAYRLAIEIHILSLKLPRELQFDLADQIRRAARSIPSNMAEGYGRNKSPKDIESYLRISLGSNDEVLFNLEFLEDVKYVPVKEYERLRDEYIICGKQLTNLIRSLTSNQKTSN